MNDRESAQTVARITTIGNSLGVIIDKKMKRYLDLKKGDFVKVSIRDVDTLTKITTAGSSIGIIIPQNIQQYLELEKGELIQIKIEKT